MTNGPFSIGSNLWPGLSKLMEEAGEVQQVIGKLIGTGGAVNHWDGTNLRERLEEEIADVMAACRFVIATNDLRIASIQNRSSRKLTQFEEWHNAGNPLPGDASKVK